ncbi:MAG: glutamate--tRNA ligase [Mycoplasmatales bacterium]
MKKVRVRYAPSPTGYLHIGNARTALFNYLYARNSGGDFIIRIEDTDTARNIEGGEQSQLDNLSWLGLEWDESIDVGGPHIPYNQLSRFEQGVYTKYIEQMLSEGHAYKCYCTSEELDLEAQRQKDAGLIPKYNNRCRHLSEDDVKQFEEEKRSFTIRLRVPDNHEITWNDMVKGDVTFNSKDVSGDFNIIKRDGIPSYNFVVVLDDHLMEISHILRGEDHISNTPKQILIYEALKFEIPEFGHMTLIVNEDGKKLSKRDTSIIQFIEDYKKLGYLPEAMFNFISLLGWSPESEQEIYSKDEFIKIFDTNRLSKSSAKFDIAKLTWINNQYIKAMDEDKYLKFIKPYLLAGYNNHDYSDEQLDLICMLYKDQISYGGEIIKLVDLFFNDIKVSDESIEFIKQEGVKFTIEAFRTIIEKGGVLTVDSTKNAIKEAGVLTSAKGKLLFMPIRIATTGQMHGPELPNALVIFQKEMVLKNIDNILKMI